MLRVFRAAHMSPPQIALSLRIDDLAFTGDTGVIPEGLCAGARLLCAECTYFGEREALGAHRLGGANRGAQRLDGDRGRATATRREEPGREHDEGDEQRTAPRHVPSPAARARERRRDEGARFPGALDRM